MRSKVNHQKEKETLLQLERVLGITTLSAASFASSPKFPDIFYAAGCLVVRYNSEENKQKHFYKAAKSVTCVAVSDDGKLVAAGEKGHSPSISVWDVASGERLASLTSGHKEGVSCVAFSADGRYLVSAGFKRDKQLILWEWLSEVKVAVQKLGNKVHGVRFHPDGSHFVTCGDRHLKWWSLIYGEGMYKDDVISLSGKPASIQEAHKDAVFMDARIDEKGNVYCVTATALLCAFGPDRFMHSWVQLESPVAYTLSLVNYPNNPSPNSRAGGDGSAAASESLSYLIVGCADGVIRVFQSEKLYYLATLPLPLSYLNQETSDSFAACLALTTVAGTHTAPCPKLASVYADHSMFVWDITDIQNVMKYRSFVYHRACIWDVQFISTADNAIFGPGTFVTCSADNSIRVWNTDPKSQRMSRWRSMYSKDMLHAIEIEDQTSVAADTTISVAANGSASVDVRLSHASNVSNSSNNNSNSSLNVSSISAGAEAALNAGRTVTDICKGIPDTELPDKPQSTAAPRALAVHPSGTELVCGDRTGLLRFFNLGTMTQIATAQAHFAEVLTLNFSPPLRPTGEEDGSWTVDYEDDDEEEEEEKEEVEEERAAAAAAGTGGSSSNSNGSGNHHVARKSRVGSSSSSYDREGKNKSKASKKKPLVLLASAGRDRLVHVFDASRDYAPISTLDNHSSSVTIVKFTNDGKRLLSCGGDRTMVFNDVCGPVITRIKSVQTPLGTINGLAVEPTNKFAVTSGQDRRLNIWNLQSGKHVRAYKSESVTGELYKSDIDPSGMFVATCAFDKTVNLFDFFSGELVAQVSGHSEVITAVRFSPDGRYVLSVGGDGCIMQWALSPTLVSAMQERLLELFSSAQRNQVKASQSKTPSHSRPTTAVSTSGAVLSSSVLPPPPPPPPPTFFDQEDNSDVHAQQAGHKQKRVAGGLSPGSGLRDESAAAAAAATTAPSATATIGAAAASSSGTSVVSESRSSISLWVSRAKEQGGYELFGQKILPDDNVGARHRNKLTLELTSTVKMTPRKSPTASTASAAEIVKPASIPEADHSVDSDDLYPTFSSDEDDASVDQNAAASSVLARTLEDQDRVNVGGSEDEEEDDEEGKTTPTTTHGNDPPQQRLLVSRDNKIVSTLKEGGGGLRRSTEVEQEQDHYESDFEDDSSVRVSAASKASSAHVHDTAADAAVAREEDVEHLVRASITVDELERSALNLESWLENMIKNEVNLEEKAVIETTATVTSVSIDNSSTLDHVKPGLSADSRGSLGSSLSSEFFRNLRRSNSEKKPPHDNRRVEITDNNDDGNELPPPPSSSNHKAPSTTNTATATGTGTGTGTKIAPPVSSSLDLHDHPPHPAHSLHTPAPAAAAAAVPAVLISSIDTSASTIPDGPGGDDSFARMSIASNISMSSNININNNSINNTNISTFSNSSSSATDIRRRETATAVAQMKDRLRSMGILTSTGTLPRGIVPGGRRQEEAGGGSSGSGGEAGGSVESGSEERSDDDDSTSEDLSDDEKPAATTTTATTLPPPPAPLPTTAATAAQLPLRQQQQQHSEPEKNETFMPPPPPPPSAAPQSVFTASNKPARPRPELVDVSASLQVVASPAIDSAHNGDAAIGADASMRSSIGSTVVDEEEEEEEDEKEEEDGGHNDYINDDDNGYESDVFDLPLSPDHERSSVAAAALSLSESSLSVSESVSGGTATNTPTSRPITTTAAAASIGSPPRAAARVGETPPPKASETPLAKKDLFANTLTPLPDSELAVVVTSSSSSSAEAAAARAGAFGLNSPPTGAAAPSSSIGSTGTNSNSNAAATAAIAAQLQAVRNQEEAEELLRGKADQCRAMLREFERVKQATLDSFGELSHLRSSLESSFGHSLSLSRWGHQQQQQQSSMSSSSSVLLRESMASYSAGMDTHSAGMDTHSILGTAATTATDTAHVLGLNESFAQTDALISEFHTTFAVNGGRRDRISAANATTAAAASTADDDGDDGNDDDDNRRPHQHRHVNSRMLSELSAVADSVASVDTVSSSMSGLLQYLHISNNGSSGADEGDSSPRSHLRSTGSMPGVLPGSIPGGILPPGSSVSGSVPGSVSGSVPGHGSVSVDEEAEITAILQKYSDKLVDMVSEKVAAKMTMSSTIGSSSSGSSSSS